MQNGFAWLTRKAFVFGSALYLADRPAYGMLAGGHSLAKYLFSGQEGYLLWLLVKRPLPPIPERG